MTRTSTNVGVFLVIYQEIDGAHFFTSQEVPGLCAASTDLRVAFEEVAVQLGALLTEKVGAPVVCEPHAGFEQFERWLGNDSNPSLVAEAAVANWRSKDASCLHPS